MFCVRALNALGYQETLFVFLIFCQWFAFFFVVVAVVIGCADATKLGTRRAATSKACTDVGALRSPVLRSHTTTASQHSTVHLPAVFVFPTTWSTGLWTLPLKLAVWFFRCALSIIRPAQIGFSFRAAVFWIHPHVESLFSSLFVLVDFPAPRRFVAPAR